MSVYFRQLSCPAALQHCLKTLIMKSTCMEAMGYYDSIADGSKSIHQGVDTENVNVNMSEG